MAYKTKASKTNNKQIKINKQHILKAIRNDEFVLYYMPKVHLATGKLHGAEVLTRWIPKNKPIIMPTAFIARAEKEGVITNLTVHAIDKLITDIQKINKINTSLNILLNVSPLDFASDIFLTTIKNVIKNKKINPEQLQIEITEPYNLYNIPHIKEKLQALIKLGIKIVLDDFGTGFSGLLNLSLYPFYSLKFSKDIIKKMTRSLKVQTIVKSSIQIAQQLEMETIAEGIETEALYNLAQYMGCTFAQGYWISKPLPLEKYLIFIKQKKQWPPISDIATFWITKCNSIYYNTLLNCVKRRIITGKCIAQKGYNDFDNKICALAKWYSPLFVNLKNIEPFKKIHSEFHSLLNQLPEHPSKTDILNDTNTRTLLLRLNKKILDLLSVIQEMELEIAAKQDLSQK